MKPALANLVSSVSLIALIALCLAWELWLAPLRPGGSWLVLKALPLLAALFGVLKGKRYTHQWLSMAVLAYLAEGLVRATTEPAPGSMLAALEAALAALLFTACLMYSRQTRST